MVTQIGHSKTYAILDDARRSSAPALPRQLTPIAPSKAPVQAREPEIPAIDAESLESAVQDMAASVQHRQRALQFSVDESSGRTVITVLDKITAEVIRQIPSEEVLSLAARMRDGEGLLVEAKA